MRTKLIVIFLLFVSYHAFAQFEDYEKRDLKHKVKKQPEDSVSLKGKLVYGGNFELTLGTVNYVSLSPTLGYYLTDWLVTGPSVTFSYLYSKALNLNDIYYGASLFSELFLFKLAVAHAEAGYWSIYDSYQYRRIWTPTIFAGGGLTQRIGKKGFINYMILFNLNKNPYLPPIQYKVLFMF